ncbi:hypothetical protein [Buchananella hordeovulneris]|uniref:hypothetical protein n=1 Tax=Buchananella hordeovulneris TaxID=52770 RepID=UPI001FED6EEB|nr:hypothetical protein [Buchananella hordeovulneris]
MEIEIVGVRFEQWARSEEAITHYAWKGSWGAAGIDDKATMVHKLDWEGVKAFVGSGPGRASVRDGAPQQWAPVLAHGG